MSPAKTDEFQAGVTALPVTVVVMLIVFIVVMSVLSIGFSELRLAEQGTKFQEGYYESDLGIQETLMRLTQDPGFICPGPPASTCDFSALAQGNNTLHVMLTQASSQGEADAACPEFITNLLDDGDVVQSMTSTAAVENQSAVVQTKAVVKIDSRGKLTLCNWDAVN